MAVRGILHSAAEVLARAAAVPAVAAEDASTGDSGDNRSWFLFITDWRACHEMFCCCSCWCLFRHQLFAQSSARFAITRSVIAGGGTTFSSSARFQLGSTIAQPLAAVPSSARFSIQGGFWIWPSPTFFAPTKNGNQLHRLVPDQSGEHLHSAIHGHAVPAELAEPAERSRQWGGGISDEFRARHRSTILPAH